MKNFWFYTSAALLIACVAFFAAGCSCFCKNQAGNFKKTKTRSLEALEKTPIYKFSESEMDIYVRHLKEKEPNLPKRIVHVARKHVGQPAATSLLGEAPFELYDPRPLYCLEKTDGISFIEQTLAASVAYDWRSFLVLMQRLRYKGGEISIAARNHDLLADWLPANNRWFLSGLNDALAGKKVVSFEVSTRRREFFKQWGIAQDCSEDVIKSDYIPLELARTLLLDLKAADIVAIVAGIEKPEKISALGLIVPARDGTFDIIHAERGAVREEPFLEYINRKSSGQKESGNQEGEQVFGFRFYRPSSDPLARLWALDGPDAPHVSGPRGLLQTRFRYPEWAEPRAELTETDKAAAKKLDIQLDELALLKARPLYEFNEKQLGKYLGYLQETEPNLRKRIAHLARKNIGQPYQLYLLGEAPFETYDNEPIYTLHKSDCVVFAEHIYAMALSRSWEEFIQFLQRIRYKNGEIGVLTRNHYTEAEWDVNNEWLVEDINRKYMTVNAAPMIARTNYNKFFKNRYGIDVDIPDLALNTWFTPIKFVPDMLKELQDGDFVNVMYGNGKECYASHVGLITRSPDGTVNFLHSVPPRVKEQPILEYCESLAAANAERIKEKKAPFRGFKFLRLKPDPIANLRKIDGPDAPVIKPPVGVMLGPGRRWAPKKD
ncbi:MAG TPA: DUF1460 domain-containing protein [Candidatus Sumerlaeia bacterium]|nr:DUF1460 domain-containing protein [Candidatus Sumerlaeia bacterium]